MEVNINTTAEAFLAIGLIVLAADGKLSGSEALAVCDSMMTLDIFNGQAGFTARRFLGEIMQHSRTFLETRSELKNPDRLVLEDKMIADLINASKSLLTLKMRQAALHWAVNLAYADGYDEREGESLFQLAEALDVDESKLKTWLQVKR